MLFRSLGLVNTFSRWVPHLSSMTKQLRELTRGNTVFRWQPEHGQELAEVRQVVQRLVPVRQFQPGQETLLYVDGSFTGLGMVLLQQVAGAFHFIFAASTGLSPSQLRYSPYEIELTALLWALTKCQFYLGSGHPVVVYTDHAPLAGIEKKPLDPTLTNRTFRCLEKILGFNLKVLHVPASMNLLADYLSRKEQTTQEAPHFPRMQASHVVAVVHEGVTLDARLVELIEQAAEDSNYMDVVQAVSEGALLHQLPREHPGHQYKQVWKRLTAYQAPVGRRILLLDGGRVVIPEVAVQGLLATLHKHHASVGAMTDTVTFQAYWPNYTADIAEYVAACETCEEVRRLQYSPPAMDSHQHLDCRPGDRLVCDWCSLDGHHYHVVVDSASGFLWAREYGSQGTTESLDHLHSIFAVMGRAGECLADNGPSFRDRWDQALRELGVDPIHGAPYHPQSQGAAERAIGRLKFALRKSGYKRGQELQALVSSLNFLSSSRAGTASPATRLWGRQVRGPLPSPPGHLSEEQLEMIRAKHSRAKAKALARANATPKWFMPGDRKSTRLNSSHSSVSRMPSSA